MEAVLISGFPGVGKSKYTGLSKDSDSSKFSKSADFPDNYMKHIKQNLSKHKLIFVSSHKVVREALLKNGLKYVLAYPKRELKQIYLDNYKNRGNDEAFINFISDNWDDFIDELEGQKDCTKLILDKDVYLSDVLG